MEEKFIKAANIFQKLSEEGLGPNDNWSIPAMQLHRAKRGNEDAKTSICLMVAASVGLRTNDVERIFDALYGGTNENKQHRTRYNMKKKIRLSENDLHRVIKESVKKILNEGGPRTFTGADNESIEKRLGYYEILVKRIKDSAEEIIRVVESSPDWNENNSYVEDKYDENYLRNLAQNVLEIIENCWGGDGYDPTQHITW